MVSSRFDTETITLIPGDPGDFADRIARQVELAALRRELEGLTSLERDLLGIDGYSTPNYPVLSLKYGMSEGALRVRRHRLLKRLRAALEKELGYGEAAE